MATIDINTAGAVALTPKGEAYALAQAGRREIEAEIERLIAVLDRWDGDPDLEPSMGALELASLAGPDDQTLWSEGGNVDDREIENEHGGDILDEPHDGNSEDLELDEPTMFSPQGSWLYGGSGAA